VGRNRPTLLLACYASWLLINFSLFFECKTVWYILALVESRPSVWVSKSHRALKFNQDWWWETKCPSFSPGWTNLDKRGSFSPGWHYQPGQTPTGTKGVWKKLKRKTTAPPSRPHSPHLSSPSSLSWSSNQEQETSQIQEITCITYSNQFTPLSHKLISSSFITQGVLHK
jgi:hypothetical protein